MKARTTVALAILGVLAAPVYANVQLSVSAAKEAQQAHQGAHQVRMQTVRASADRIFDLRNAVLNYYDVSGSFPANLAELASAGMYTGPMTTTNGGALSSVINGNQLQLNADMGRPEVAQMVAAQVGGTASGNIVTLSVGTPATQAITNSMLSRFYDPARPDLNVMQTDLGMGGHSINNVGTVTALTVDATDVQAETLDVQQDANFRRNLGVTGKITTADLTSTGQAQFESATFAQSVVMNGGANITGLTELDTVQISKSLAVTEGVTVGGTMDVGGEITAPKLTADEVVGATGSFDTLRINGLTELGRVNVDNLTVFQDTDLQGNARVRGSLTLDQDLYVGGQMEVAGLSSMAEITSAGRITALDGLDIAGATALRFSNYGGGWHMTDSDWIRAYGGKGIFTSGIVRADGGIQVDGQWVVSADGSTLYEDGEALRDRYLAIDGKAKSAERADDADRLGGVLASQYARRDAANTFTQLQTFNQRIEANGGLRVDGKWVVSADGNTLYEAGQALSTRYLGIDDKAKSAAVADNALKLGGANASAFARRDQANTFTQAQTMNSSLRVNGATTLAGLTASATNVSTLNATGKATLRGGLEVWQPTRLNSTLFVSGQTNLSTLVTSGNATVGSNLTVNGTTRLKATNVTSLTSSGDVRANGGSISLISVNSKVNTLQSDVASLKTRMSSAERWIDDCEDGLISVCSGDFGTPGPSYDCTSPNGNLGQTYTEEDSSISCPAYRPKKCEDASFTYQCTSSGWSQTGSKPPLCTQSGGICL